jgi:hypothetical protein
VARCSRGEVLTGMKSGSLSMGSSLALLADSSVRKCSWRAPGALFRSDDDMAPLRDIVGQVRPSLRNGSYADASTAPPPRFSPRSVDPLTCRALVQFPAENPYPRSTSRTKFSCMGTDNFDEDSQPDRQTDSFSFAAPSFHKLLIRQAHPPGFCVAHTHSGARTKGKKRSPREQLAAGTGGDYSSSG